MMKHILDRNSLEKLYFGCIRPILEYGSVVWDNCTREQSDLIESVQCESARIATGLRKLYDQIQRKGKSIESCESSTTSNEMVNSIEYLSIRLYSKDW
jgi:hypothetical protein